MQAVIEERSWRGLEELEQGLRRFLARHCRDENVIDDVVQETFVRAACYRTSLTEDGRLRPWVNRIALNVLADLRRRGGRYVPLGGEARCRELVDGTPGEEPPPCFRVGRWSVAEEDLLEHLKQALEGMRGDDRAVLRSYYGGRGLCRETAQECEIPAHLVKMRLFRARRRLVRAIEQRLAARSRSHVPAGVVA